MSGGAEYILSALGRWCSTILYLLQCLSLWQAIHVCLPLPFTAFYLVWSIGSLLYLVYWFFFFTTSLLSFTQQKLNKKPKHSQKSVQHSQVGMDEKQSAVCFLFFTADAFLLHWVFGKHLQIVKLCYVYCHQRGIMLELATCWIHTPNNYWQHITRVTTNCCC